MINLSEMLSANYCSATLSKLLNYNSFLIPSENALKFSVQSFTYALGLICVQYVYIFKWKV